jgi:hypothetical protein
MGPITRREMMRFFGLGSAAIALVEAGLLTPANAARDFTWASTGGSWGEHLDDIFVKKGGFAEKTHLAQSSRPLPPPRSSPPTAIRPTTSAITERPRSS